MQDVVLGNTLTYDATSTYTLRIYGLAGSKRALDLQVSNDDGATWQARQADFIAAGTSAGWRSLNITSWATSQTQLDKLRVRLICNTTASGGGAGQVEVDAVHVEGSLPTTTLAVADPAFSLESGSSYEGGAWAVGNFKSTGSAILGGSVYVQGGDAGIAGGGFLKSFVQMPSGAPSLYGLGDATQFG